jgi:hypothetical protein
VLVRAAGVIRISVAVSLCAACTIQTAFAQQWRASRATDMEYALIKAFDDCIQERFRDLSRGVFGAARLESPEPRGHWVTKLPKFRSENARESAAVRALDEAGLRMVLFLGSRRILEEPGYVILASRVPTMKTRPVMIRPLVAVTSSAQSLKPADVPQAEALMPEARRALPAFTELHSTEAAVGRWQVVTMPVRASSEACLGCHRLSAPGGAVNQLRVGDPLGAILYAFQRQR